MHNLLFAAAHAATATWIFIFITLLFRFKLPESPRWLLVNGRIEELVKVIEVAAYWNKITLPENYEKSLQKPDEPVSVSFGKLFTPQYMRTTFLMIIVWYALILLYFGITLHLNNLGGDIYLNSVCIYEWGFGCILHNSLLIKLLCRVRVVLCKLMICLFALMCTGNCWYVRSGVGGLVHFGGAETWP